MSDRLKYIALGDSMGVGVGATDGRGYVQRIAAKLEAARGVGVAVANLCVSGATSVDVLQRQVARAEGFQPATTNGALFTLLIGVNDLWRGATAGTFGQTYASIVTRLRALGGESARIVVASLPDMAHAPAAAVVERTLGIPRGAIGRRVREFNVEIARAAKAHATSFLDLQSHALGPSDFSGDGFHPSSAGYERLAQAFVDILG